MKGESRGRVRAWKEKKKKKEEEAMIGLGLTGHCACFVFGETKISQ